MRLLKNRFFATGLLQVFLLLSSSFVLASQALAPRDPFMKTILGGATAKNTDPAALFTVLLEIMDASDQPKYRCTGVVIEHDLVLTAGHCLPQKNLRVKIKYGLGGPAGFQSEEISSRYESSHALSASQKEQPAQEQSPWKDGYLAYDKVEQEKFLKQVNQLKDWTDFTTFKGKGKDDFRDLAVIKITALPKNYRAIKIYTDAFTFRQQVFVAGYGVNSRMQSERVVALKWAQQELIGFGAREGEDPYAFAVYSPDEASVCYSDSGGPAFVMANGEPQLLGIIANVTSACTKAGWIVAPLEYRDFLMPAIERVRKMTSI